MYGFAILSSINYRQTMKFAVKYHQLATPLVTMEFKENDGCGIWLVNPLSYARIHARLSVPPDGRIVLPHRACRDAQRRGGQCPSVSFGSQGAATSRSLGRTCHDSAS